MLVNAMPTDAYARTVVSESLKAKPRAWIWAGKNSYVCWFMDTFLPRTVFVGDRHLYLFILLILLLGWAHDEDVRIQRVQRNDQVREGQNAMTSNNVSPYIF